MASLGRVAILLEGRKGAGKSALGSILQRDHGFREFALADPLRDVAVTAFDALSSALRRPLEAPLTVDACKDPATKEAHLRCADGEPLFLAGRPLTPRWLLQWLGTDVMRACLGEDVWVQAAAHAVERSGATRVVVTDVRFHNEAALLPELLRARGFRVVRVRVVNPDEAPLPADAHASEREADALPHEVEVTNDKARGLGALERAASELVSGFE